MSRSMRQQSRTFYGCYSGWRLSTVLALGILTGLTGMSAPVRSQEPAALPADVEALLKKMETGRRRAMLQGELRFEETGRDSLRREEFRVTSPSPGEFIAERLRLRLPHPGQSYRGPRRGGGRRHGDSMHMLRRLSKNFKLTVEPGMPVAGRPTTMLRAVGRHDKASMLRMWVDDETGLVLRRTRTGSDGISRTDIFTKIRYTRKDNSESSEFQMQPTPRPVRTRWSMEFRDAQAFIREAPFKPWILKTVPAGYEFEVARVHDNPIMHGLSLQRTFTDGMTSFSIFQSHGAPPDLSGRDLPPRLRHLLQQPSTDGETVEMTRGHDTILMRRIGSTNLTVLGSAPRQVLLDVMQNLQPPQP